VLEVPEHGANKATKQIGVSGPQRFIEKSKLGHTKHHHQFGKCHCCGRTRTAYCRSWQSSRYSYQSCCFLFLM
jgi:hypothetical protein